MNKRLRTLLISIGIIGLLVLAYLTIDSFLYTGIKPVSVSENGIIADFYSGEQTHAAPAIVIIGGGIEGTYWSSLFAQKGYSGLSLPYCLQRGLPPLPEEIPLEYVEKAIDWLGKQPEVNPDKIIVMGASRNAELALLVAATFPDKVHGVIAYAPSSVSWSNTVLPYNSDTLKPSWTYQGQDVSYISMDKIQPGEATHINTFDYWKKGLTDSVQVANATIKVENINGPVLLFSGLDDQVWPSAYMSDLIERRLKAYDFAFPVHNVQYEDAGHRVSGNPDFLATQQTGSMVVEGKTRTFNLGGTAEGDQRAQRDAQKKVFGLLKGI